MQTMSTLVAPVAGGRSCTGGRSGGRVGGGAENGRSVNHGLYPAYAPARSRSWRKSAAPTASSTGRTRVESAAWEPLQPRRDGMNEGA